MEKTDHQQLLIKYAVYKRVFGEVNGLYMLGQGLKIF